MVPSKMKVLLLLLTVTCVFMGVSGQGKSSGVRIGSKDTDIQILHQLLMEERNSRRTLETELKTMKAELTKVKVGYETQNKDIQEIRSENQKLKASLSQQQPGGVNMMTATEQKEMMADFTKNASDIVSKMQTLSRFVSFVETGNSKINKTLMEVLSKLEVLARNLTSANIVIKAYLGPMLSTTMKLNTSLTKLKREQDNMALKINEAGGGKVGFYAYSFNSVRKWPGSDNVVFEKIVTNEGNAYNASNGVFTAPSDGLYVFIWTMTTYEGSSFNAYLMKNGNDIKYLYVNGGVRGGYETGSTSALLQLKRGDSVYIRGESGGRLEYPNVVFTGFKL